MKLLTVQQATKKLNEKLKDRKFTYHYQYKVRGRYSYSFIIEDGVIKDKESGPDSINSRIIDSRSFLSVLVFHPEEYEKFVDKYLK